MYNLCTIFFHKYFGTIINHYSKQLNN